MTHYLALGVFALLCALFAAWVSQKKESVVWAASAFLLVSLGTACVYFWAIDSPNKPTFTQTNEGKNKVYVSNDGITSTLGCEKTSIMIVHILDGREYTHQLECLSSEIYTSLKTEAGQTLYVPEWYVPSK
ncbi:MAG: hypothetical protein Q7S11_03705 [bacterium]|nr:hypothetical protein [bacterium]